MPADSAVKFIFVTGGVTSSLGKGIVSASLGRLLEARGLRVTIQKFDPYINVDAGTMNPFEHGEVYVTDDGAETDLDLGHYERYLGIPMSQANNVTTGRVYSGVIAKERAGAYLGKTVQVVPHVIDEIKGWMRRLAESGDYDVILTEIGGTAGDIESLPYLEAIRQLALEEGRANTALIHLTLVPYLAAAGELKTKPTQHSVKTLQSYGLQPDLLVCRTEHPLPADVRKKIALFCNVGPEAVVESRDAESIYEVPLLLREQRFDEVVLERLGLTDALAVDPTADLESWVDFLRRLKNPGDKVTIALVGKYVEHQDAYKSISESFLLAGARNGVEVDVRAVLSDDVTEANVEETLAGVAGVLVAPGFGDRGIDGKIEAVRWARESGVPFFGICLGMQIATIEFARTVAGLEDAHSTEFEPDTPHPVIAMMAEQKTVTDKGGTMRLGAYDCALTDGTLAREIYGTDAVKERHRHRYEVNNDLRYRLREAGLVFSGLNPDRDLVEIIELPRPPAGDGAAEGPTHPWFVGVQFHPEYRSRVSEPHPLFVEFVGAAVAHARGAGLLTEPKGPTRTRRVRRATARVLAEE
ncbi:CTP synthase [Rubrivirga sp. IMCC45206]|uniref:CTP synthase n=1 Tax=Rubrivirga sp. IMCC45206 TaxID=3391614 RepID=UPI0039900471